MENVDPIRARLDVLAQWGDFVGPVTELTEALRAVLDLLGAHIPGDVKWINDHEIHRVIAEHLGVTDDQR